MKRKLAILVLIVLLAGSGVYAYIRSTGNSVKFKTARVTAGDIRSSVTATGTTNAVTTVLVGTQVSGTLKSLHVDFNSRVKKGQLIAEIDPDTFRAQVDQARANLLAAQANVLKARASEEDSRRIMERNKLLHGRNLIAKADLDTSETNHSSAKALTAASEAQVKQAEAALRVAEINLEHTRIISPVDGVVVSRNVDVGQTVAASFQTPTLFTIAQDLTKMQIDTNIDEADIGKIKIGQDVTFTVDAYTETLFTGKVAQVRIAPITVQNVVTYDVVIRVDNTDLRLKPGMTANVSIVWASKEGILKVPNAALRFKPPETLVAQAGGEKPQAPGPDRVPGSGTQADRAQGQGDRAQGQGDRAQGDRTQAGADRAQARAGLQVSGPDAAGARPEGSPPSERRGGGRARPEGTRGDQGGATVERGAGRPQGGPQGGRSGDAPGTAPAGQPGSRGQAAQRGGFGVWIADKSGKLKKLPVTVGISDGAFTEIIGPVKEGMEVVVDLANKTGKANGQQGGPGGPGMRFPR